MAIEAPIDSYAVHKDAVTGRNNTGALTYAETDRFKPSRLGPDETSAPKKSRRRSSATRGHKRLSPTAISRKLKPLRLFDWALLAIEVTGALVVAWLAWQYIYTVYIDTAPRRVSTVPSGGASSKMLTATPSPSRVAEVAPPLVGSTDDSKGNEVLPGTGGASRSAIPTAAPTIEPKLLLPSRLRIPAMFLDSPVHEVTVNMGVWEVSPMDIGHHQGTANPGDTGNMVLAGHRDINSALFRELDRLQPGDEIFVSNGLREYRYVVKDSIVVSPDHIEVMEPTNDRRVTLITCTPIGIATQRLVVTAILDE